MGAVETLIVWENLAIQRHVLRHAAEEKDVVLHLTPTQEKDRTNFIASDGVELERVDVMPLLEWFANNYKTFGYFLINDNDNSKHSSSF